MTLQTLSRSTSSHVYQGRVVAVIFDWAGTVIDFGCMAPVEAFRQIFADVGVPISEIEARQPMGAAKREHIQLVLQIPAVQTRWREHHGSASTQASVDDLYREFLRVDEVNVSRHSDMIPGALDTVSQLRDRGVLIGSTTGYPREVMNNLMPLAEKNGYRPDLCVTVSDVKYGRPWPDMCLANALAFGVPDVRACVVVDDSPSGLAAGRAAGMWAVGISASGNEVGLSLVDWQALDEEKQKRQIDAARQRLDQAGAHYVIDSVADLLPVIEAIEARLAKGEAA